LQIRKAELPDSEIFVKLRIAMRKERDQGFQESENNFITNTQHFFIENIKNGAFVAFFATDHAEVTAMSGISVYNVPPTQEIPNGKIAYLMSMYTLPQYRKRGIAAQLLERVVKEAKLLGCDKVTLNASPMAKPLYTKFGFKNIEDDMAFYLPL
jgi:GNAT superfamily N-acetyltransferase